MANVINATSTGNGGLVSTGDDSGILNIQTNETTAITVDTAQNVGIGTASPLAILDVASSSNPAVRIRNTSTGGAGIWFANSTSGTTTGDGSNVGIDSSQQLNLWNYENTATLFATNNTERMRLNAAGFAKISNTGTYGGSTASYHEIRSNQADIAAYLVNTNASTPYGLDVYFSATSPNNSSQWFYLAEDSVNLRFVAMANGGIKNYSANNVNLSDRREKTNFAPAKSYLNTICSIPVQTFNYIDQNLEEDAGLTLGVVAQDVQEVAPELVHETNWAGKDEEPKMRLSIYQTDLQYALMKSVQELKAINDTQAETINALTARIVALESK